MFLEAALHDKFFDYRITWILFKVIAWVLSLWMVYALLRATLANLPGILRLSQKILNIVFPLAAVAAILTIQPEYAASGLSSAVDPIDRAVLVVLVMDRSISTVALLALLAMLVFILWFPVQMPRNLAVFSVGFVAYFASKTMLLLLHSFFAHQLLHAISNAISLILVACFTYWLVFLNAEGERAPVRIGHSWRSAEQTRLIEQLEAMNTALLRSARR
ncbi:MAG: hypothetical protein JOY54_17090 [Acidobacteriaceae bacterium]|nr:hypothetical protein [Acidobacteriaceae bacterium]